METEDKPEIMTQGEQLEHIVEAVYSIAEIWAHGVPSHTTMAERCHGVAHNVLALITHGDGELPAFQLTPVHSSDEEVPLVGVHREGGMVDASWDYDTLIDPVGAEGMSSVTNMYETIYNHNRGRMTMSARDLFGK